MKKSKVRQATISRYDKAPDGSILIDVAADRTEDLYNNFDKSAPYIRRDLDQDLADYLIACAKELGKRRFAIRFTLLLPPNDDRLSRIRRSVRGFFLYLAEVERRKIHDTTRRSLVLFGVGLAILSLSVWLNNALGTQRSVISNVFAEGLTIAAWVSLWEALATSLIDRFPRRKNILLYHRLADAPLIFRPAPDTPFIEA